MAQIFPSWANKLPVVTALAAAVLGIGAVGFVWYYFSPWYTDVGYRPKQPVMFSHLMHADSLGLDRQKFDADRKDAASAARVFKDQQAGLRAGVQSTPTVFINGRKLKDRSFKGFSRIIEKEIESLRASP